MKKIDPKWLFKQKYGKFCTALLLTFFLIADIFGAAIVVSGDYLYSYMLPHKLNALNTQVAYASSTEGDWSQKFKDKFSDKIISTDTVYKSPNISVEITKKSYDSGVKDPTASGKHLKYGTKIAYLVADIYIRNINCLKSAFAQNTYGVGYSERISAISKRLRSVLAVNGDSYSNNRHKENGTIIRNGIVYRTKQSTEETCVLYHDGTMKIYKPKEFNAQKVIDGRQNDYSRGMFLDEMAKLFEDLGCKAAYNLDGGHSSFMLMKSKIVSHPYSGIYHKCSFIEAAYPLLLDSNPLFRACHS